jgi:hypothetical protein
LKVRNNTCMRKSILRQGAKDTEPMLLPSLCVLAPRGETVYISIFSRVAFSGAGLVLQVCIVRLEAPRARHLQVSPAAYG